eukprot:CAMPEP_0198148886 /NCGR_PEP_ID=MMETSP1443-20131203/43987_1 /TAXON_ID=186043 /ORGANISM="Entomoneis sp., Strain CCMP2396" /LENGTH=66 /DNA_ID=CAMNT_0043813743 /DNA_START=98 /DNA_END=295 /DNA_ORIENTATION=-
MVASVSHSSLIHPSWSPYAAASTRRKQIDDENEEEENKESRNLPIAIFTPAISSIDVQEEAVALPP